MTTRVRTTLIAAGATGMLAVVLASCGSSGAKPDAAAPSATAPAATTTALYGGVTGGTNCAVPALPGQRVTVVLSDMGGRMMGGRRAGVWRLHAVPQTVSSGTVSLVAVNHGTRTHELVVLPLAARTALGARPVGADNTVAESGSLGEASADCRAGGGDGITAGGAGWVSLTLQPGRYELICNLPGHYAAGMHTELDVT